MGPFALAAGICAIVAAVELVRKRSAVHPLGHIIIFFIFSAGVLKDQIPLRYVLFSVIVLLGITAVVASGQRKPSRNSAVHVVALILIATLALVIDSLFLINPETADPTFRYVFLLPVSAYTGFLLTRQGLLKPFYGIYGAWAIAFAVGAMVETARGDFFQARESFTLIRERNGFLRSIMFSEHYLVLAVLLLAAVPFARALPTRLQRNFATIVLLGGVLATGSRGVLALFVMVIITIALKKRFATSAKVRRRWIALLAVTGLLLALTLAPTLEVSQSITSTDSDVASIQYRFVLIFALQKSLALMPLGWGIGNVPTGRFLVPMPGGGINDIAETVDSEIVHLGIEFGILGLAIFGIICLIAVSDAQSNLPTSFALVAITLAGTFVSLHSWTGLGVMWFILIGATIGDLRSRRDSPSIESSLEHHLTSPSAAPTRRQTRQH